ncbi:MAG: hypothetical protein HY296_04550 [Thaumarchaeota archaeon]|nr:hypothetical protein [Nitrososphaerota archaeon]
MAGAKKLGLYQWIDFRRKLSSQDPEGGYKVLYTGSATYLTASVVDLSQEFAVSVAGARFKLNNFIAESKTYRFETKKGEEAFYLASVLNSTVLDQAIKPIQTRGLFGARDIHKRPLLFPIPKYDDDIPNHQRLAELGREAQRKVSQQITEFSEHGIARARQLARDLVRDEIGQIDRLVGLLLGSG